MAVVLSRAVVNAHSASRIALMELFKAEHFQMQSGVASGVCVFVQAKNMFVVFFLSISTGIHATFFALQVIMASCLCLHVVRFARQPNFV